MGGKIDMVLDVRTAAERDVLGVYPNAIAIPSSELTQRMPVLHPDKSQRILIYCNTGQRARRAAEILHGLGYTHSYYITTPYTQLL
jgi:phage shock protein E